MKYNIKKNWINSFEFIKKHPVILLPFVVIAFLESLTLELISFAARFPVSVAANPIIRKFFGEAFNHYPANYLLLPKLFYYIQVVIYITLGVFLTGVCVNIFKNIKERLPLKANALVRNAFTRYFAFFAYGIIIIVIMTLFQKADTFVFGKFARLSLKYIPQIPPVVYSVFFTIMLFIINLILQTLFVLTIPILVLAKKPLWRAVLSALSLGTRKFFTVASLIFLPFLMYLPITFMKSISEQLVDKTFPEITALVTVLGIVVALFADCYILVSTSQFVIDEGVK